MISGGYRLSPRNKYPVQIDDVCACYNAALKYLSNKGVDASRIIVAGPSAGAHLTSILCYSKAIQEKYGVDIAPIIGFIGFGGPYSFRKDQSTTVKLLLNQLFSKGYDRREAEPVSLMSRNPIPMLLIQSRHDGLIQFECAQDFAARAEELGNIFELYTVEEKKNTHSWYTAGLFQTVIQQGLAIALTLVFRQDPDRSHGQDGNRPAFIGLDGRMHIDALAD